MASEERLAQLEHALHELVRDWERFFAGIRKTPPEIERKRMEVRLRVLSEQASSAGHSEQFRLEQIQHRFVTYCQNWERMLREREEGRTRAGYVRRPPAAAPAPPKRPVPNETRPATVDETDALFARFVAAKRDLGQAVKLDRETFARQLDSQRKAIEERMGREVRFDVVVEDGKVKLAARRAAKPDPGAKR